MDRALAAFEVGIEGFLEDLPEVTLQLQRRVTLEAYEGIVVATPVDTGRARANWQLTRNAPAGSTVDRIDPAGGTTVADGLGTLARAQPGDALYITNNLPYIWALEHGHSRQAPAGMVAVTLTQIAARYRR